VGEDDFGRSILERLRHDGVSVEMVASYPNRSTGVAFVTYFRDGTRRFLFHLDGTLEARPMEECARMASAVGALNAQAFGPMEGLISPSAVARLLRHKF